MKTQTVLFASAPVMGQVATMIRSIMDMRPKQKRGSIVVFNNLKAPWGDYKN